jgi:hypothetical protein
VTKPHTDHRQVSWWFPASVVYALVAALCQPLTTIAAVAALVPGVAVLAARLARPLRPLPEGARPGRAGTQWLGLLLVGALWELVAALWGNDAAHPTFSLMVSPAFEHHYPVRVAGYVCWLALGRWLVNR